MSCKKHFTPVLLFLSFLSFSLFGQTPYCSKRVDAANVCGNQWIRGVNVSNVSNINNVCDKEQGTPQEDGYSDYSEFTVYFDPAVGTQIIVDIDGNVSNAGTVWVDWNNNGTFEDTEMTLLSGEGFGVNQLAGVLQPTPDAVQDVTILGGLRVSINFLSPETDPCGSQQFGEIEDYSFIVTVQDPPSNPPGPYCSNSAQNPCNFQWIETFDCNNISQNDMSCDRDRITTGNPDDGYSDYTEFVIEFEQNQATTATITVDGNVFDVGGIMVDWNANGNWEEQEIYQFAGETTVEGSMTAAVAVPPDAVIGRVITGGVRVVQGFLTPFTDGCTQPSNGEIEDYSFMVVDPTLVLCPTTVSPADGATDVCTSENLVWNAADSAVSYDVLIRYVDTQDTLIQINVPDTFFTPAPLLPDTTYEWRVISVDKDGRKSVGCTFQSFRTAPIAAPTVSFTNTLKRICEGSADSLFPQITSSGTLAFDWRGDVLQLSSTTVEKPVYTASMLGTDSLNLRVEDEYQCADSAILYVETTSLATVNSFSLNPDPVCFGDQLQLMFSSDADSVHYFNKTTGSPNFSEATPESTIADSAYFAQAPGDWDFQIVSFLGGCTDTIPLGTATFAPPLDEAIIVLENNSGIGPCEGTDYLLHVSNYTDVVWQDGTENDSTTINSTTDVHIVYSLGECTAEKDTLVRLLELPDAPTLQITNPSGSYCQGDSVWVELDSEFSFEWQDGNTTETNRGFDSDTLLTAIAINPSGCISVESSLDLVFNTRPEKPSINVFGLTTPLCEGTTVSLVNSDMEDKFWSTGETIDSIVVQTSGYYSVTTYNGACQNQSDSILLVFEALPPQPSISMTGHENGFCKGDVLTLSTTTTNPLWSTGETSGSIDVGDDGSYFVSTTDGQCTSYSDTLFLTFDTKPERPMIEFIEGSPKDSLRSSTVADSYIWLVDGAILPYDELTIPADSIGEYLVLAVSPGGCRSDISEPYITVSLLNLDQANGLILRTMDKHWIISLPVIADRLVLLDLQGRLIREWHNEQEIKVRKEGSYLLRVFEPNQVTTLRLQP